MDHWGTVPRGSASGSTAPRPWLVSEKGKAPLRTRPTHTTSCLRRDPFTSHHIHAYNFGKKGVGITFDSGRLSEFVTKTEIARTWPRLKLGEGKAENQNNMINALFGEVVNLMDMNQVWSLRGFAVHGAFQAAAAVVLENGFWIGGHRAEHCWRCGYSSGVIRCIGSVPEPCPHWGEGGLDFL